MIKTIALDAFGTLCQVTDRRNPYGKLLLKLGTDKVQGRRTALMRELSLSELAAALVADGAPQTLDSDVLLGLNDDLTAEIASIQAFPEAIETLKQLKQRGCKIAVVSNLAQPYGAAVRSLFQDFVDVFVFSFAVGAAKPEAAMFQALVQAAGSQAHEILMVGDSRKNDYDGARLFGMSALHLDRSAPANQSDVVKDLVAIADHLPAQGEQQPQVESKAVTSDDPAVAKEPALVANAPGAAPASAPDPAPASVS